jgi:hypothetical protein
MMLTSIQYLMVDIVVNHNGWNGNASSVDYSVFRPFNNAKYFHNYCKIDYGNETSIEDCWLGDSNVELADLRTESAAVAQGYQTWIKQLVANYSSKSSSLEREQDSKLTWHQLTASVSIRSSMSILLSGLASETRLAFSSLEK